MVNVLSDEPSAARYEPVSAEKSGTAKNGEFFDLPQGSPAQATVPPAPIAGQRPRKPTKGLESFDEADSAEMEALLEELNGHLGLYFISNAVTTPLTMHTVVYPLKFLEGEVMSNNLLFLADR